jgi:hypothetical protein
MATPAKGGMCPACEAQRSKGKYAPPHEQLRTVGEPRRFSSAMGAADEKYYKCETCGHDWLHETGSAGMGWVP